ncbi:hypothetical protein [Streptomyces sp. NPDC005345]|uniref:hypothetical protein n=1 Tax=Streptomyces sp. NPDC005345 TaxID=3156877 RepID=UPI0033B06B5C
MGPAALLRQDRRTPLVVGLVGTAWGRFAVARTYFAARGEVPRDLMAFLADAHEHRGVLRQVGVIYQFRHLDLQRHLARRGNEPG